MSSLRVDFSGLKRRALGSCQIRVLGPIDDGNAKKRWGMFKKIGAQNLCAYMWLICFLRS